MQINSLDLMQVDPQDELCPTDGEAIPRMKDGVLVRNLNGAAYPWDCHAIRGLYYFRHPARVWLRQRSEC